MNKSVAVWQNKIFSMRTRLFLATASSAEMCSSVLWDDGFTEEWIAACTVTIATYSVCIFMFWGKTSLLGTIEGLKKDLCLNLLGAFQVLGYFSFSVAHPRIAKISSKQKMCWLTYENSIIAKKACQHKSCCCIKSSTHSKTIYYSTIKLVQ